MVLTPDPSATARSSQCPSPLALSYTTFLFGSPPSPLFHIAEDEFLDKEAVEDQMIDFAFASPKSLSTIDDVDSISDFFNFPAADSTVQLHSERPLHIARDIPHGHDAPGTNHDECKLLPQTPSAVDSQDADGGDKLFEPPVSLNDVTKGRNIWTEPSSMLTQLAPFADVAVRLVLGRDCIAADSNALGRKLLLWASEEGDEVAIRKLLSREDFDPNSRSMFGLTPLIVAAQNGHKAVVQLLLSQPKINPNAKDGRDRTPLWCATREGHECVVRLLLERDDVDPDGNDDDTDGCTPLMIAASHGHAEVLELQVHGPIQPIERRCLEQPAVQPVRL